MPQYYVTVASADYFDRLLNLIGSIHENNYSSLVEISVFDIGLTDEQKKYLNNIAKLKVYSVEKVNPYIFDYFKHDMGRMIVGWYSWKPVVIKKAMELHPYFLFLDAGTTVLGKVDPIFDYITHNGSFFISGQPWSIFSCSTKSVLDQIINKSEKKDFLLGADTWQISSGCIGLSNNVGCVKNFVSDCFACTKKIELFADDGTAASGFGRHDQIIFSIYARLYGLNIFPVGYINLSYNNQNYLIHTHYDSSQINEKTVIYSSRRNINYAGVFYAGKIRFKN